MKRVRAKKGERNARRRAEQGCPRKRDASRLEFNRSRRKQARIERRFEDRHGVAYEVGRFLDVED